MALGLKTRESQGSFQVSGNREKRVVAGIGYEPETTFPSPSPTFPGRTYDILEGDWLVLEIGLIC
jgi:hypothetical protein